MGRPADKLIVLDRDGVINVDSDQYIKSVSEWQPLPGSLEAIRRLAAAGYVIAVVTNQSGVGRGLFTLDTLDAIHAAMLSAAESAGGRIDSIYVCPHAPDAHCNCRKPAPGLLEQLASDYGRSLVGVPVIGDKLTDVLAARAAGARPVFVLSGHRTGDAARAAELGAEVHVDLASAVDALLSE